MNQRLRQTVGGLILCIMQVFYFLLLAAVPAHASQPCDPPNLIPQPVCDMDSFHGVPPRQVPDGWTEFVIYGDPIFYQADHSFFGGPNLTIASIGGTFKAGIFTQTPATPGAGYRASISWGAPNKPQLFGRQLGIDPTGGTDPNSPNIIWGPMHWGDGRILNYPPPDVNIDVRARAINSTITVFFVTDHPQSAGDDLIFVDVIALYPDESAPAVEIPPTNAPEPPAQEPPPAVEAAALAAAAPAAVIPTNTPVPTETPTATETPSPTPSPTFTATPTETPSPSPTSTATWTPFPTVTSEAGISLDYAQTELRQLAQRSHPAGLTILGMLSLGGAGLCAGSLWWLRRKQ